MSEHSSDASPILAFDIGGTNLRAALVVDGRIIDDERCASGRASSAVVASRAAALAHTLESRQGIKGIAVGVGLAAMVPLDGIVVENAPNLGWTNAPFRQELSDALGARPVVIRNDLDAITIGEHAFGAARGCDDALVVFVGTGVGAGIIANGALVRGHRGVAAELGHIKVSDDETRRCGCGAFGCLEAFVGGGPLLAEIERLAENPASSFAREKRENGGAFDLGVVEKLIRSQDREADALWTQVAHHLGRALANTVTLLNPRVVVMGGGVWSRSDELRTRTRAVFAREVNRVATIELEIVDAALGEHAGILGAAQAARDELRDL